jgi:hypothetical protein
MQLGATDCGQITRDPGFALWCGDELCTWKTLRGEVRRAPTWHAQDAGVELVGPDTAIAQLTPVDSGDATCIRFELLANVDANAEVLLKIDVFGDGQVEREERIPAVRWEPVVFTLPIEAPYAGIRFELAKRGAGTAIVAQIEATTARGECEGLVPAPNHPAPLGSLCDGDNDCASGMCRDTYAPGTILGVGKLCVACDPQAPTCGSGEVCGLGDAFSPVQFMATTCVPANGSELGEPCGGDEECATGICTDGVCSTCGPGHPCGGDEQCGASGPMPAPGELYPSVTARVCSPNAGRRGTGEPCATSADCASGTCNGVTRQQCADGRACDSPMQCPADSGLTPGACTVVGVQGGSCQ